MSVEPQALESEEHVVGAMLLSPARVIDAVEPIIGPLGDAFYREQHQLVYRACLALHGGGIGVDVVSVVDFLDRHGMLEAAGGKPRLHELAALVPSTANAAHHAKIVVEHARLRALLRAGAEIARLGQERPGEIEELVDRAEQIVFGLRGQYAGHSSTVKSAFEMASWLDERTKNPMDLNEGVPSPWSFLPRLLPGRLYVLAGYQADGKTAMAAELISCASKAGRKVGFASLEMGWQDVAVRLGANAGGSAKQLETGHVRENEKQKIAAAIGKVATMNLHVLDDPFPTVGSIHRFQRLGRYDLLLVDHLHQFPINESRFERQELEAILRGMVGIARDLKVPVILLCQLSRVNDPKKPFPRPTMASLRGTAMIEALAWCVWFIWRQRDEKNLPKMESEFIVAKNRSGRPGAWPMMFHDREVRFTETRPEAA